MTAQPASQQASAASAAQLRLAWCPPGHLVKVNILQAKDEHISQQKEPADKLQAHLPECQEAKAGGLSRLTATSLTIAGIHAVLASGMHVQGYSCCKTRP